MKKFKRIINWKTELITIAIMVLLVKEYQLGWGYIILWLTLSAVTFNLSYVNRKLQILLDKERRKEEKQIAELKESNKSFERKMHYLKVYRHLLDKYMDAEGEEKKNWYGEIEKEWAKLKKEEQRDLRETYLNMTYGPEMGKDMLELMDKMDVKEQAFQNKK